MRSKKHNRTTAPLPPAHWSHLSSPLGRLLIAVSEHGLCAVKFAKIENQLPPPLRNKLPAAETKKASAQASGQLQEFFAGRRRAFDLPLDLSELTPFQREVLTITSRIPWGEVWSYQRVAQEMGKSKASRAVGQALGRNPIPIVIPCHRVIASDGGLGGYCGTTGLELKRWLLRHEGVQL